MTARYFFWIICLHVHLINTTHFLIVIPIFSEHIEVPEATFASLRMQDWQDWEVHLLNMGVEPSAFDQMVLQLVEKNNEKKIVAYREDCCEHFLEIILDMARSAPEVICQKTEVRELPHKRRRARVPKKQQQIVVVNKVVPNVIVLCCDAGYFVSSRVLTYLSNLYEFGDAVVTYRQNKNADVPHVPREYPSEIINKKAYRRWYWQAHAPQTFLASAAIKLDREDDCGFVGPIDVCIKALMFPLLEIAGAGHVFSLPDDYYAPGDGEPMSGDDRQISYAIECVVRHMSPR